MPENKHLNTKLVTDIKMSNVQYKLQIYKRKKNVVNTVFSSYGYSSLLIPKID